METDADATLVWELYPLDAPTSLRLDFKGSSLEIDLTDHVLTELAWIVNELRGCELFGPDSWPTRGMEHHTEELEGR